MLRPLIAALLVGALAGCISHGPEGVAYTTGVGSVGSTGAAAEGSLSGGSGSTPEKERRGNTPLGMDRDGHGPAAGAIIDPTGAATRGKPY